MRFWAYFIGGLFWVSVGGASSRAYLPAIGPSPLRLLTNEKPALVIELPSLAAMARPAPSVTNVTELSSEQSVASVAIDAAAEPDLDVEPDSETEVMKPVTVVAANPGSTNTFQPIFSDPLMNVPSAQSRETVLESLVNLFKHDPGGTNRIDKTILLPLHFLTVPDSKPLSSQATYSGP